jgi:hypothetical protein
MYTDECVSESATGPLVLAPPYPTPIVDHLWGAVRDDVAVVEISGPGRTTRRVRPIAITGSPIRRTVVAALDPPAVTDGLVHGDLLRREFVLRGGPVIVRALATDGRELSAVAVGKAGCPIPPGCAP